MDHPRNHPGALADVGHEHDRYQPITFPTDGKRVDVLLRNVESESELHGTEKQISLGADDGYLSIRYALPKNIWWLSTEVCLSPDYYRLLRHGRDGLADFNGKDWRGWSTGSTCVWARIDGDGSTIWDKPFESECGHGLNLRISSFSRDFQIEIGVGTPPDQKLVNDGRSETNADGSLLRGELAEGLRAKRIWSTNLFQPAFLVTDSRFMRRFFDHNLRSLRDKLDQAEAYRVCGKHLPTPRALHDCPPRRFCRHP